MGSKIEWTERSDWNPIRGCTRVSPGCGGPGKHGGCYAERIAARFSKPGQPFHGFAEMAGGEARWTGKVELVESHLALPLTWRKPAMIFANSMSDFFHESVPDEWLDQIFAVMALAPQHTFQCLSKRSKRMRAYIDGVMEDQALGLNRFGVAALWKGFHGPAGSMPGWPLPNCWLGISAEDQERADERVPDLVETPAAVRFISYEPALGQTDFTPWLPKLDLIIAGAESGKSARKADNEWFRRVRWQCFKAEKAFFMKQLYVHAGLTKDMAAFPEDLRVREFPQ